MCVDAEEWTQESGKGSPSVPKRRWLSIQSQKKKKERGAVVPFLLVLSPFTFPTTPPPPV